jgi:conjugal transfer mating pair stabilization protein TraN
MVLLLSVLTVAWGDAFQDGKALVEGAPQHIDPIDSSGIPISDNPPQATYVDDTKIAPALERERSHNEGFQMIKQGNKTRASYEIEVEIPDIDETANQTGTAVEGALGRKSSETETQGITIYKTCIKSGESYTKTCRRQRIVEIKITPEVIAQHPKTCPGHWEDGRHSDAGGDTSGPCNWISGGYVSCGGCQDGAFYVAQPKIIDIIRDDWAGCEELERLHDLGQAEIINEEMGPAHETHMIDGEPITKDYWETTRTYALNTERFNGCEALKAMGCVQHDSRCEEYTTGMAGERICKRYKLTYACRTTQSMTTSKRPDLDGFLPPKQTAVANQNMFKALSQMEVMRQMAKHMEGDASSLRIFRGEDQRCSINFGGAFKNCCTSNGGFGTRMHIATKCTGEEEKLAKARAQNRCIFVGARVKSKVLGVTMSKEQVYCCYPTKLGLALQKGARTQLGKTFGTAEGTHCEGLTPDELSRVDFSQIDLSDAFADIAASAQKMEREIKVDLAQKQRQFERPDARVLAKNNQPQHKRVDSRGETHDIVY